MNGLSIMLLLADIVGNVAMAIGFIAVFAIIVITAMNFILLIRAAERCAPEFEPIAKKQFYFALAMIVFINIIPSKETIYLIAGSEIGETIITAPENVETMEKVRELVNTKLDEIIANNKGEDGE